MDRAAMVFGVTLALTAGVGCKSGGDKADVGASVAGIATTHGAELFVEQLPLPGSIETVDVEGDRAAIVVVGDGPARHRPILHLHGTCAVARADVESWSSTA